MLHHLVCFFAFKVVITLSCVHFLHYCFSLHSVNYRGSTGFGQDSILSLIGQIGSQDVKDVQVWAFCF